MENKNTIGYRIKQLRKSSHMTQTEFGNILKKDGTTIGRYEKNQLPIPSDTLQIIAEQFETSIDYIITGCSYTKSTDNSQLDPLELNALTLFRQLSKTDRQEMLEYMEFKLYRSTQTIDDL